MKVERLGHLLPTDAISDMARLWTGNIKYIDAGSRIHGAALTLTKSARVRREHARKRCAPSGVMSAELQERPTRR